MVNITVDTDGISGDYASLALAIAALISGGSFTDDVTITCYATTSVADTTNFDMSGLDTTSSYTLYITAGDSNYNLSFDLATLGIATAIIYSDTTNTLNLDFFGITIDTDGIDANYEGTFYFNHSYGDIKIRKCYITEVNGAYRARTFRIGCDSATYGGSYEIKDNMVVAPSTSTDSRSTWLSIGDTPDLICYNNTVIGDAAGTPVAYRDESGTGDDAATFVNNIFYNVDTPGVTPATHSYNISNLNWNWGGTGESGSVTITFVGGGDYHLDSSDTGARGNGIGPASDSNVETTDIDGNTRSGTTCDVGADEYVSTGETGTGTDGIDFSESATAQLATLSDASDYMLLSELVSAELSAFTAGVDGIVFADSATGQLAKLADVAEAFNLSEAEIVTIQRKATGQDGITFSELANAVKQLYATGSDGITFSEFAQGDIGGETTGTGIDGLKFSELASARIDAYASGSDVISFSEIIISRLITYALANDGIIFSDIGSYIDNRAVGIVTVTFTSRKPAIDFEGKLPEIEFTSKKPKINFIN